MQRKKKGGKEMGIILIIFLIKLSWNYLSGFFWLEVYQIDLNLCFVPIFISESGKHISILTIILRNALL
jgi:hypothetical protein